jgi:hypothetical protein
MILGIPARKIASVVLTATWSPLTKYQSTPTVLSGSNLILTANTGAVGTYANAVSSREVQDLGYYSGVIEASGGENGVVGLAAVSRSSPTANFPGGAAGWVGSGTTSDGSAGIWANTGTLYRAGNPNITGASGNAITVEMAVRIVPPSGGISEYRFWIRQSGGAWYGGGDPVANTTPSYVRSVAIASFWVCVGASIVRSGATSARRAILHGDAASTTGTVPTGFTAAKWGAELT